MDDAGGVRGGQAIGDLRGNVEELAGRDGLAGEQRAERLALNEFADNVLLAGLNANVVHGDDVGVVERGNGAGFTLKAGAQLGAGCALLAENLDGDIAVEARVAGAIHLAHAAYSECGLDLIDAKAGIGS